MKIIKSFLLVTVGICATTLLYAQDVKTETAKPEEIKIPTRAATNTPSPAPEFKPQPGGAAPKAATSATVAEAPSPLTRKENVKPEEKENLEAKIFNKNDIATPGGEEGRKKLAGKSTSPAPEINNQSTIDPKPAPQVKTAKPTNGQQQQ